MIARRKKSSNLDNEMCLELDLGGIWVECGLKKQMEIMLTYVDCTIQYLEQHFTVKWSINALNHANQLVSVI